MTKLPSQLDDCCIKCGLLRSTIKDCQFECQRTPNRKHVWAIPEPTQSPAKSGSNSSDPKYLPWEWKLKHFLQNQHGSAGWEMKLENLVGMLREEAHAAGEKEGIDKCLGKLEIGTKSTKELFPYAVQAPTEEWALLCIEKDAYNRGVKDAEQALKSLLPLDTNN